jgi:alginate O-acetyltransferase complex protein AlgI
MSFVTWQYFIFLPLVFLLYWRLPRRPRLALVLVGSYVFYGFWDVRFLALVLTTTVIDYCCGLAIDGKRLPRLKVLALALLPTAWLCLCSLIPGPAAKVSLPVIGLAAVLSLTFFAGHEGIWAFAPERRPKGFLVLSIVFCLAILGFFKYFGFFVDSAKELLNLAGFKADWTTLKIILPVGISFYTFQSLGYVMGVYRGHSPTCPSLLTFATFDAFFPQLVAGPIERARHLIPQLEAERAFDPAFVHDALPMIVVGLFKKLFVADNCALLANYAFDPQTSLNGYWAVLGVVAFAFQIYGDFSGYTDIARGSAKLLGIDLVQNFKFPYFSRNPSDFWSRWHISLSTWFRDFLYIPLGGNRGTRLITLRNLALTMLLAGLWHGASWIFVLWGAYHGALLILYHFCPPLRAMEKKEYDLPSLGLIAIPLMWVFTLVGWAIFRSPNLATLGGWFAAFGHWPHAGVLPWGTSALWLLIHTAPLLLLQVLTWKYRDETALLNLPWAARGLIYTLLLLLVVSSTEHDKEFIYFQF